MVFSYKEVENITEDVLLDGDFKNWFHEVWSFYIEPAKLNVCGTIYDIIGFYRLISGLCRLYKGFCCVLNDDDYIDFEVFVDIDYKPLFKDFGYDGSCEDTLEEYVFDIIHENGFSEVRKCLAKAGVDTVFASLYYSVGCEDFSFSDNFNIVLNSIMNEVTADKMSAYEWLREVLG